MRLISRVQSRQVSSESTLFVNVFDPSKPVIVTGWPVNPASGHAVEVCTSGSSLLPSFCHSPLFSAPCVWDWWQRANWADSRANQFIPENGADPSDVTSTVECVILTLKSDGLVRRATQFQPFLLNPHLAIEAQNQWISPPSKPISSSWIKIASNNLPDHEEFALAALYHLLLQPPIPHEIETLPYSWYVGRILTLSRRKQILWLPLPVQKRLDMFPATRNLTTSRW